MATVVGLIGVQVRVNSVNVGTFRVIPVSYAGVLPGNSGPYVQGCAKFDLNLVAGDVVEVIWGSLIVAGGVNFTVPPLSTSVELRPK